MFFCEDPKSRKGVENRSQNTTVRGRVAIHASSRFTDKEYWEAATFISRLGIDPPTLSECRDVAGKIIGSVSIWGCLDKSASQWYIPPRKAWLVHEPIKLSKPLAGCKGKLGFWEWDGIA